MIPTFQWGEGLACCCADSVWLQSGCTPQGFHCKVSCFALSRNAILARLDAGSYAPISHFPPELLKDNIITKVSPAPPFETSLILLFSAQPQQRGLCALWTYNR